MPDISSTLVTEISSIIKSRSNIAYLHTSISAGKILKTQGYVRTSSNNLIPFYKTDWIRLTKINDETFDRWIEWAIKHDDNNQYSSHLTMFNPSFINHDSRSIKASRCDNAFDMGINIDREFKMSGSHISISSIFPSYIADCCEDYGTQSCDDFRKISTTIYKLIYIGEKNYLIGYISKNAILYLDTNILSKLYTYNGNTDKFKEIVERIISVFANANSNFFSLNTKSIDETIVEKVLDKIVSTAIKDKSDYCVISPQDFDLFKIKTIRDVVHTNLIGEVRDQVKLLLHDSRWGINNQYSYKKLVDNILMSQDTAYENGVKTAYLKGLSTGIKFKYLGWNISTDRNFNGCSMCWEKDVNIIPTRMFYNNTMYDINPDDDTWHNPFKITKLFVTLDGVMYCEGEHPNVQSGFVCMGDLKGNIEVSDEKHLQENLSRCEQLLYTINFDSAYRRDALSELMQHSKVNTSCNTINCTDTEFVASGSILQDVSYEEEGDEVSENNESDIEFDEEG